MMIGSSFVIFLMSSFDRGPCNDSGHASGSEILTLNLPEWAIPLHQRIASESAILNQNLFSLNFNIRGSFIIPPSSSVMNAYRQKPSLKVDRFLGVIY